LSFVSQFWPLLIGAGVAATVVGGRFAYTTFQRISSRAAAGGVEALTKKFYDGGFEPTMTRREAALLLGCRYRFVSSFCGSISFRLPTFDFSFSQFPLTSVSFAFGFFS
jgi:DnaJ family protein C protein 19